MELLPMKLKLYYRRNLKMSDGKLAAQCVHAATGAKFPGGDMPCCVLSASDARFEELKGRAAYVVRDAGFTELPPGTETVLAIFEP
jgi:peptidyl-tRNA hydrolase